jgi:hypothetical protein
MLFLWVAVAPGASRSSTSSTQSKQTWLAPPEQSQLLPPEVRQKLLDAIDTGAAFRTVVRDLGLTSQQVWGLTRTDQEWLEQLEAALTASRRDDLQHGTNAAYVHGCACRDCREHQQKRMGRIGP